MTNNEEEEARRCLAAFFRLLNEQEEIRNEFVEIYPDWREMRHGNIQTLDEMKGKFFRHQEPNSFFGFCGNLNVSTGFKKLIEYSAPIVAATGHGVAAAAGAVGYGAYSGVSAARRKAMDCSAEKLAKVIRRDYENTRDLVRSGIRHEQLLREIDKLIRKMQATIPPSPGFRFDSSVMNLEDFAGSVTHRGAASLLIDLFESDGKREEDTEKTIELLRRYQRNNADMPQTVLPSLRTGFDFIALARFVERQSLWLGNGFDAKYGLRDAVSERAGLISDSTAIQVIESGRPLTLDGITGIRKQFMDELILLDDIYKRLGGTEDTVLAVLLDNEWEEVIVMEPQPFPKSVEENPSSNSSSHIASNKDI